MNCCLFKKQTNINATRRSVGKHFLQRRDQHTLQISQWWHCEVQILYETGSGTSSLMPSWKGTTTRAKELRCASETTCPEDTNPHLTTFNISLHIFSDCQSCVKRPLALEQFYLASQWFLAVNTFIHSIWSYAFFSPRLRATRIKVSQNYLGQKNKLNW